MYEINDFTPTQIGLSEQIIYLSKLKMKSEVF